ncbi:replication initiation factor domain-containing protein [Geobacter sp. AOG1]|uniref:replication initiation factor domain-containing protein n=1 Tax=Geobacter sp. AOG1 TaxID=1566346 RepID=UPI001CC5F811|nr:replication initiation factor domain-containing protein [Geobacter sp. AOG1]GFE57220.1 Cro/Cl family transcriptional regulator [Geobacter sp. AOG1]
MISSEPLNRGAQNTQPKPSMEVLIDWLSFTLPDQKALDEVLSLNGFSILERVKYQWGKFGYKAQRRCGNAVILSDGMSGMGIHVEMTGQACREFEMKSGQWHKLISKIFIVGGHFTRLDFAIDDREGHFSIAEAQDKMQRREVRSRFKKGQETTSYNFSDAREKDGKTLYFGSPKSAVQIRIYDKAVEQNVGGVWIRTEIQCRHERANTLANYILESDNIGSIISNVLKSYLNFIEPATDSNKARWPVSSWWNEFLGTVERLKLKFIDVRQSVMKVPEWLCTKSTNIIAPILNTNRRYSGSKETELRPPDVVMINLKV